LAGEVNMKRARSLCRCILTMLCLAGLAAAGADATPDAALEKVLGQMDSAAEKFHTTEASVVWDQYQKIVDKAFGTDVSGQFFASA
jgi:hypothetical protein